VIADLISVTSLSVKEKRMSAAAALGCVGLVYDPQIGDYYSSNSALNVWMAENHS
jgi:hypothetical protein